jgi:hypothetical protein
MPAQLLHNPVSSFCLPHIDQAAVQTQALSGFEQIAPELTGFGVSNYQELRIPTLHFQASGQGALLFDCL